MASIGTNLKRLREERAMTQEQLAAGSGLKQAAISKYENGTAPDVKSLMRLAVGLKAPISAFLIGINEGFDLLCQQLDPSSGLGGPDVPASAARLVELERRNTQLEAAVDALQNVADDLVRVIASTKSEPAARELVQRAQPARGKSR